jgi:AcrR family transcriptional regulator
LPHPRGDIRRSQIVDEAIRIFGALGNCDFTVQAPAERCDLPNAGLLHYFGSTDSLLLALLDEIERREEAAKRLLKST